MILNSKTHFINLLIGAFCFLFFSGTILAQEDSLLTSLFDKSIEELINQEVSIATKSSQQLNKTPAVVSVITAAEIKSLGIRDFNDVAGIIPGFENGQTRLGSKVISIRGVSDTRQGGRLLVLIDGIPKNECMYGTGLFFGNEINFEEIEQIEIIRGPGSALYGKNAFSCVVNFITKKAKKDNNFSLSSSIGSYNTYSIAGSYELKKENFSSRLSAKYYTTDGTNKTFSNGIDGESVWNLKHDNFYLNYNAQYKDLQVFANYTYRINGNSSPILYLTNASSVFNEGSYGVKYNKQVSSKINFSFNAYGRNQIREQNIILLDKRAKTIPYPTEDSLGNKIITNIPLSMIYPEGLYAEPFYRDYTYGFESNIGIKITKFNNLLFGIQGDFYGVKDASVRINYLMQNQGPVPIINNGVQFSNNNMPLLATGWLKNNGHSYRNVGLYFQDIHYFTEKIGLTLGGRLDFDSQTGAIFNPRLGMVAEVNKFVSAKILYGKAYRAPNTGEQYKYIGFEQGNENLKPEEISTGEAVISFKTKKFISHISYYINDLNNMIVPGYTDSTLSTLSFYNTGKNRSQGIEMENKFFFHKNINFWLNYSYTNSIDIRELEGKTIETKHQNISNSKTTFGLNLMFTSKISLSSYLLYCSPIEKFRNLQGVISQQKIGDYYMLNSTMQIKNVIKSVNFYISAYNILNQEIYFQDDQNAYQPQQPGINFIVGANYSFK